MMLGLVLCLSADCLLAEPAMCTTFLEHSAYLCCIHDNVIHLRVRMASIGSLQSSDAAGGRRKIVKRHGLVYEHRQDGMRRLQLVRGLSNMFGQYNCFLNVVIQSLWHLPAFRNALLSLPSALPDNGASPKDAAVLRALHNIFAAFAKAPPESQQAAARRDAEVQSASADSAAAHQLEQQEAADSSASSAFAAEAEAVVRQSISPDELREALSNLDKGQSPVEFELSEMHDAAEVQIFLVCLP